MRIEYFGVRRQLLGSYHLAQRLRPRSTAVVLCNPFGEEASRAHRSYRVLATQLERAGFPVLRFDYSGTGDSLGDSVGVTMAGWLSDIGVASDHLRKASGASRICLVGLRLGATLAMLASARGDLSPRHLLMWDPVVDGSAYLRELGSQHQAYLLAELGSKFRDRLRLRPDGTPTESLGMPIGSTLADELGALDLSKETSSAEHVTVISTRETPEGERLRSQLPLRTRWLDITEDTAWNSDAALNAMIVPMKIVNALVSRIEETCT